MPQASADASTRRIWAESGGAVSSRRIPNQGSSSGRHRRGLRKRGGFGDRSRYLSVLAWGSEALSAPRAPKRRHSIDRSLWVAWGGRRGRGEAKRYSGGGMAPSAFALYTHIRRSLSQGSTRAGQGQTQTRRAGGNWASWGSHTAFSRNTMIGYEQLKEHRNASNCPDRGRPRPIQIRPREGPDNEAWKAARHGNGPLAYLLALPA